MSDFKDVAHKTVAELFDMLKEKVAEIERKQAEIDLLKRLIEIKDRVRDEQQAQIDELKHQKSLQELAINQISQANQEWQRINSDLQKRVDGALNYAENRKLGNGISGDNCSDLDYIIRVLNGDFERE